jgi:ATP-dependent Lhr-like helicase
MQQAGRWSLVQLAAKPQTDGIAELVARALLDRYGVVFRMLVRRESRHLPPWRDLVRVLRRLEARGEVRGGRFVNGFAGEQFAWPGAVEGLRREREGDQELEVLVSGADPLNLTGIVTPGERVPASARNRVWYRGGVPVIAELAGHRRALGNCETAAGWSADVLPVRSEAGSVYRPRSAGAV